MRSLRLVPQRYRHTAATTNKITRINATPIPMPILALFEVLFGPFVPEEPASDVEDGRDEKVGRVGSGKRELKDLVRERGGLGCSENTLCWRKELTHSQEQLL